MTNNFINLIKAEKHQIAELINPQLSAVDLSNHTGKQIKQELIDVAKFIAASKENIQISDADFKVPDLLIQWDGEFFGLEHTEITDQKKKKIFENTEWLIKETEGVFLKRYGNIYKQITFGLDFEVVIISDSKKKKILNKLSEENKDLNLSERTLLNMAHPGYMTVKDLLLLSVEFAEAAYQAYLSGNSTVSHDLLNYISFYPSGRTFCNRNASWGAGSIREPLLAAIKEKELKIEIYKKNTKGLKQCLFLLIHGSNGYSDYSNFDEKILLNTQTLFDKVVAFNFFTNDFFILK